MTIESGIENAGVYIDSLDDTYPAGGDDLVEGDNHIRGVKNCLLNTFSNITGAVTSTHTELNYNDITALGAVEASKVVTVDANLDAETFRNIGLSGNLLDTNSNELIKTTATSSAVNEITVANAASAGKPAITQTGADDVGVDIEGVELHNGTVTGTFVGNSLTAETTNGDLNFARNGTGDVTVDSVPIYGLVILDDPVVIVNASAAVNTWTDVDMSAVYAAAHTAGAVKAIVAATSTGTGGGTDIDAPMELRVRKSSSETSNIGKDIAYGAYDASSGENGRIGGQGIVNLDANSDFQWDLVIGGLSPSASTNIYLVGYYV